jgi:SAM-dependent methyltransferase
VKKTWVITALLALSLSLLAGCRKDVPADGDPKKDAEDVPKGKEVADPKKDGGPKKDGEPKKPVLHVRYVPTPEEVMDKMLEVANLTDKDVLYDLGCGDGRIVIAAARKYKCKAVGYDLDPERIKDSEANKAKEPKEVQKLLSFVEADIMNVDLSGASVVTVYLLRDVNEMLIPAFKKMKPGSRIVAHNYPVPGVKPDEGFPLAVQKKSGFEAEVYRYTTPIKVEDD